MKLKRTSGIIIPKVHPEYEYIEKDLNRVIYTFTGDTERMIFYKDLGDSILIPRNYPLKDDVEDLSEEGQDINITSNIVPRNERQKKAIRFLVDNNTGVLSSEPASGKTVMAIDAISKINKKAIIFAHKTKLLEQWEKSFLEFTNLSKDDIGRLSTNNYEESLKKKIILCTPHVISIAVKNDKTDFLYALRNSGIGIMIVDEVHVGIGPSEFSKASLHLNCRRNYGLSATPCRKDGNGDIIKFHVGDVKYIEPGKDELINPKIFLIYFNFGVYSRYRKYLEWGGKFSVGRYYKQMYKSEKYNEVVSKLIKKCYDGGRNTIVLGMRISSLLELAKRCGVPKEDIGFFVPTSSSEDRLTVSDTDNLDTAFLTKKVVFSTYNAGRDGNNREDLDCLVHATPSSNVEQSVGRIQRPLSNKPTPVVMDLVDIEGPSINSYKDKTKKVKWFVKALEKRVEVYERKNWEMEIIKLGGN